MKNPYASLAEQIATLIRLGVPADQLVPCSLKAASTMYGGPEGYTGKGKHGSRTIYARTPGFRYTAVGAWKWGVLRIWADQLAAHRANCAAESVKAAS